MWPMEQKYRNDGALFLQHFGENYTQGYLDTAT